jgi:tetratricopeptide (TPR) repeat protein
MKIRERDIYAIEPIIIDREEGDYLVSFGEMIHKLYPETPISDYYIGLFYEKRGRYKQALKNYKNGYAKMDQNREDAEAYYQNIERVLNRQDEIIQEKENDKELRRAEKELIKIEREEEKAQIKLEKEEKKRQKEELGVAKRLQWEKEKEKRKLMSEAEKKKEDEIKQQKKLQWEKEKKSKKSEKEKREKAEEEMRKRFRNN